MKMSECEKVTKSAKIDIIDGLKERLPQIFEDEKVNFEKLKALLTGEIVEKEDDRFYFNWAGKSKIFRLIQEPAYGTLKPDKNRSIDFDGTENIAIVGENLETLKLLLKPYFGKVKMIYIDPPYNTGKDFIYRDNFKEPLKDYLEKTGQMDGEGNKLTTNTEASGRYHSDWLNFMYPRLFLAKNLLRDDGVIFVSIDDNEVHNLRKMMDEIFGEENFVAMLVWRKRGGGGSDSVFFSIEHEYLIVYAKKLGEAYIKRFPSNIKNYPREDEVGRYTTKPLHNDGLQDSRGLHYDIECPDGSILRGDEHQWVYAKDTFERMKAEDRIIFKKSNNKSDKWTVYYKLYMHESKGMVPFSILYKTAFNKDGNSDLEKLGLRKVYSYPKPIKLIKYLLEVGSNANDLILDFFAGSGTTGHAIWDLNREDGGNRKFILINLDEEVQDENIKKEYPTVADICIERLKRVSEKYQKDEQQKLIKSNQDFGFKVFNLAKSNFNLKDEFKISGYVITDELKKKYLDWLGLWVNEPLVGDWKSIDVVYELILKEGLDLNSKVEEMKIKNNNFYHITDEKQGLEFYISLDEKITEETVEEIRTPNYGDKMFVFMDKALTDNQKINLKAFVRLKVI
ncbi:MAG: putative methyltransferase [Candidatus Methanolliviera sp. GoM_asphalt]|nr:MAG: putative methyltransferase [Candidatus Methanolliviera sp. GoM_asphalt]